MTKKAVIVFSLVEQSVEKTNEEIEKEIGGKWDFEIDPVKGAHKMLQHIDKKRKALGIDKARERVLMTMADRQQLEAA